MSAGADPAVSWTRARWPSTTWSRSHETLIEDTETPVSAFLKLRAANPGRPAFLLESAEQGRVGRYSFIGDPPPQGAALVAG